MSAGKAGSSFPQSSALVPPRGRADRARVLYDRKAAAEFLIAAMHQAESLPVGGYAASLLLVIERRDCESDVNLRIDSLDVKINPNFRP